MPNPKITALLDAMTLEEQVSLLSGADFWTTNPIPRLGIPAIKVSDGPNGARGGGSLIGGVKAAAFPVGIALAAAWDVELTREIGVALAAEAKSKGARMLLAPTVNIHRSTLNGRNFECYSEDPFLSAEMAVAYICGLQSQGIGATVKHFIGNESEYQRMSMSSDIDARTLREIYLPPFEAAVKRGNTLAVMSSYNKLNGKFVSEQPDMIANILRGDWGFDGLVMSDWFGTYSTAEAVNGGQDLEMPGPTRHRGEKLLEAVRTGSVKPQTVRASAERVLRLIERVGGFESPEIAPERTDDRPQTRALIRRAGAAGTVLLKNDGVLPLVVKPGSSIAVIGPNAATARIMGGGSAQLNAYYSVSPLAALRAALPHLNAIGHEQGCTNDRLVPVFAAATKTAFFAGREFNGEPVHRISGSDSQIMVLGDAGGAFDPTNCSARVTSQFTATETGEHAIGVVATGPARLKLDGEIVLDAWDTWQPGEEFFGMACDERTVIRRLEAGRTYAVTGDYRSPPPGGHIGITALRLGIAPMSGEPAMERAVELARHADFAIVYAGLNGEWDSEGKDRPNLDLPGRQNELISRVAAVNSRTVVVLQTGCPATMPWLGAAAAVLQAWYPGQEAGNSITDVLLGLAEPGGRLPQTFPARLEDDPARDNYPGSAGRVSYAEGVFVGYRSYQSRAIRPLFPFGFGLSYSTFELGPLSLSQTRLAPGDTLTASVQVTNTGKRAGSTVVQLYVADEKASVPRPPQELKGFAKVALEPGASRTVTFPVDMRALAFFDVSQNRWLAEAGAFTVLAGFSSDDTGASATLWLDQPWAQTAKSANGA